jgi:hypothetical protein
MFCLGNGRLFFYRMGRERLCKVDGDLADMYIHIHTHISEGLILNIRQPLLLTSKMVDLWGLPYIHIYI